MRIKARNEILFDQAQDLNPSGEMDPKAQNPATTHHAKRRMVLLGVINTTILAERCFDR